MNEYEREVATIIKPIRVEEDNRVKKSVVTFDYEEDLKDTI